MKKKAFVKMKVWADETSYNKAVESAQHKINIVKKAKAQGLPKSTWVRFVTLKAIANEI